MKSLIRCFVMEDGVGKTLGVAPVEPIGKPVGASCARDFFLRTFTYVKQNQDPNRTIE